MIVPVVVAYPISINTDDSYILASHAAVDASLMDGSCAEATGSSFMHLFIHSFPARAGL